MSTVQAYRELLQEFRQRIGGGPAVNADSVADNYELAGALDLLTKFLVTGAQRDLDEGLRRLERVFERQRRPIREWAQASVAQLRYLSQSMNQSDRIGALADNVEAPAGQATAESAAPDDQACDCLVVAALYEPELTAFLGLLTEPSEHIGSASTYVRGATYHRGSLVSSDSQRLRGTPLRVVAVCQDRPGMTDCAFVVSSAIRAFRPKLVAMTGVCAGRQAMGVALNDLVLPREVFTYDTGKYTDNGFEREPLWCGVSDRITQRARTRATGILADMAQGINRVYNVGVKAPVLHIDVMACGSAVVDQRGLIDSIADANRKVVGVDMESYALLRATELADERVRALVVKGVMDLGASKKDSVKKQAAFWAASFLAKFVLAEFDSIAGA